MIDIPLTKGLVAIIDNCNFDFVAGYRWFSKCKLNRAYASANVKKNGKHSTVVMHRLIMGFPDGLQVDHINGNSLDNRLCNLRVVTPSQNTQNSKRRTDNTSGFKGVSKHGDRWQANIGLNRKQVYLGLFDNPLAAYSAYCKASVEMHGQFGRLV